MIALAQSSVTAGLAIADLRAVSDLAHAAGAVVIVDNVFATPVLQRPLECTGLLFLFVALREH